MAKISAPWLSAVRTTARTAGFIPCASPPLVITASRTPVPDERAPGSAIYCPLISRAPTGRRRLGVRHSRTILSAGRGGRADLAFDDRHHVVEQHIARLQAGDPCRRLGRCHGRQDLLQLHALRILRDI